jgi:hypothetical protein
LGSGCTQLGPPSIQRDRFSYSEAISDSWKRQTLLNIVKLRYADPPAFLEVGTIISGYSFEGTGTATMAIPVRDLSTLTSVSVGAQGKYTDKPTITYVPMTGQQFMQGMMTPLPPSAVLFMVQAGWNADLVLGLTADSINGVRNRTAMASRAHLEDPRFGQVLSALRQAQMAGALSLRIERFKDKPDNVVLSVRTTDLPAAVAQAMVGLRGALGLKADRNEYRVVYGAGAPGGDEVGIGTRSMIQILIELGAQVEVPESDLREHRAARHATTQGDAGSALLRIRCDGEDAQAFAAVSYRGHTYWIDDRDFRSKTTFAFLMLLFTFTDPGARENLPVVTIQAG